jgi:D-alanyl-D-alanine carboxypeptidase
MRRPIRHVTGAAAVMAVLVAVSLAVGPGAFGPGPGDTKATPGGSVVGEATARPSTPPDGTALPTSTSPAAPDGGGGTARPVELLPLAEADAAALEAAVDRARASFGLNALAVGVSIDGRLGWSGASGFAPDGRTPLTGASPFAIASVTKTFTAAIVLQLVDEGRVSLDAPVTDYLPGLDVARGVTVEQLLSHRSGIADLLAPMRDRLRAEPSRLWTPEEVVALVGPSVFAPGSDWGYSNTNYVIAGMLVEAVAGNPFGQELERRITAPLGLLRTRIPPGPEIGYMLGASWTSAFWTSAALASSAADLVRWGDALYGGSILRPATLDRMLDFNADDYGLGAERYVISGLAGYGHSGLLRGYTTLLVHLPGSNVTVTVMARGHTFAPAALLTSGTPDARSILSIALGISPD